MMSAKTKAVTFCVGGFQHDCSFPSTADIPTLCNLCFLLKFYHQSVRNVVVITILIQGQTLLTCWLHVNLRRESARLRQALYESKRLLVIRMTQRAH